MHQGAYDYFTKPVDPTELRLVVARALEHRRLKWENLHLKQQLHRRYGFANMVGTSDGITRVFDLIRKVADTDSNVLILGESGTGKELIAHAIHYNSVRRDGPLIPVNCAAIPEELLESELFGHERGAFTHAVRTRIGRFELANGGTIFLDEISEMSPGLQVKILRVLQDHSFERIGGIKTIRVDIRVIAATNRDLEELVRQNRFREDLFYRLNVIPIRVPPLRERVSDIPLLIQHFLQVFSRTKKKPLKRVSPAAMDLLRQHAWPGNVRELENLMERLVILTEGEVIEVSDLPEKFQRLILPPVAETGKFSEQGILFTDAVPGLRTGPDPQGLAPDQLGEKPGGPTPPPQPHHPAGKDEEAKHSFHPRLRPPARDRPQEIGLISQESLSEAKSLGRYPFSSRQFRFRQSEIPVAQIRVAAAAGSPAGSPGPQVVARREIW